MGYQPSPGVSPCREDLYVNIITYCIIGNTIRFQCSLMVVNFRRSFPPPGESNRQSSSEKWHLSGTLKTKEELSKLRSNYSGCPGREKYGSRHQRVEVVYLHSGTGKLKNILRFLLWEKYWQWKNPALWESVADHQVLIVWNRPTKWYRALDRQSLIKPLWWPWQLSPNAFQVSILRDK